jgi:hypothetical protein
MNTVYVPATGLDDWRRLLGKPDEHWVEGRSAMLVAKSWQAAEGFPRAIRSVLDGAGEPFSSLAPLLIFPEHQVPLSGGNNPSQSDVWVLASHASGHASITVEAKVSESFGPTLAEWLIDASDGKRTRLRFLTTTLGLPPELPGFIRYQLLHRVASAVIEAKRFGAGIALCVVQSFSNADEGLSDFQAFVSLFQTQVSPGQIVQLSEHDGIKTYVSWVRDAAV